MTALADAIADLTEANAALRKRRALAKPERTLERAMAQAFTAEGRAVLTELARARDRFPADVREADPPHSCTGSRPRIPVQDRAGAFSYRNAPPRAIREAVGADDLVRLYDQALANSLDLFTLPIDTAAAGAVESGMAGAVADLGINWSFTLKHPAAVEYLTNHGLTQVTRIRATTRETLRGILTQAADEGWSYTRTAKAIRERYAHFSVERARNIAVYELGDAYEAGNRIVADDLAAAGLVMEKSWLSVGDAKVRPEHRANGDAGWIEIDATFPSGHDRPPTDPRCRCAALYRRKPDA